VTKQIKKTKCGSKNISIKKYLNTENNNQKESSFGYHTGSKGSTPSIKQWVLKWKGSEFETYNKGTAGQEVWTLSES